MIPKKIHYIWLGGNKKSKLIEKCIASWKKYCPDYEIIEWNESNFDINCCDYVKEAYENQKWAFASDYIRHKILYEQGGIYLDTDVEFIKSLPDYFLEDSFLALENKDSIATGLIMATYPSDEYCKYMINQYENDHLVINGEINMQTVCSRTTDYFDRLGFNHKDENQKLGIYNIYASEYFCPKDYKTKELFLTDNSYTIHHYNASWVPTKDKLKLKIQCLLGDKATQKIVNLKKKIKGKG